MSSSTKISISLFFLLSNFAFSQSVEDLSYLEMLPQNQAQSIAEKLGIQTGKPINDEIKMDTFDEPSFSSSEKKTISNTDQVNENADIKIFGFDLFKEAPTTFAPIDLAPAPIGYILGPGDELRVQFLGSLSENRVIPVNREGNIVLNAIGVIQVSGLTIEEAVDKITSTINANIIGASAEISLSKVRSIQVFVLGNAFSPGAYTVSALSNISNVLFFCWRSNRKWIFKRY